MTLRDWILVVIGAVGGVSLLGGLIIGMEVRRKWSCGPDASVREHMKGSEWGGGTKW